MRFFLKVLSLPVVAALSVAVMILPFPVACAGSVLKLVSFLAFLLGAGIAIVTDPVAGGLILLGAFLISPFGFHRLRRGAAGVRGAPRQAVSGARHATYLACYKRGTPFRIEFEHRKQVAG